MNSGMTIFKSETYTRHHLFSPNPNCKRLCGRRSALSVPSIHSQPIKIKSQSRNFKNFFFVIKCSGNAQSFRSPDAKEIPSSFDHFARSVRVINKSITKPFPWYFNFEPRMSEFITSCCRCTFHLTKTGKHNYEECLNLLKCSECLGRKMKLMRRKFLLRLSGENQQKRHLEKTWSLIFIENCVTMPVIAQSLKIKSMPAITKT